MKKTANIFLILISTLLLQSCEETYVPLLDYVTFEATSYDIGVDPVGTSSTDIKIFTTQVSSSSKTFNIGVIAAGTDATGYSIPTSVTVPANSNVGTFTVTASGPDIDPDNGNTIEVEITDGNGSFLGQPLTINLFQECQQNEVVFDITFDSWPEETSWELRDANDTVIDSAAEGTYAGEDDFSKAFCLPNGTYTFIIYDAYSDGTGSYKLTYNGTILVSGGAFGASESTTFTLP